MPHFDIYFEDINEDMSFMKLHTLSLSNAPCTFSLKVGCQ